MKPAHNTSPGNVSGNPARAFLLACAFAAARLAAAEPAPSLEIWHGETLLVGHLGPALAEFNLLGAVSHPDSLRSLTWSLGDGAAAPLDVAPGHRLAHRGDFNAEIPLARLRPGPNRVRLIARWSGALETERTVTLDYRPGGASPLPQRIRWREVTDPQLVGRYTDGHWRLTPDGLRTVTPGYDRVFLIGEAGWRDYEVTGRVTFHRLTVVPGRNSGRVKHAGFCLRWNGHAPVANLPAGRPKHGLHPRGGITWLTYREGAPRPQREFYPGDSEKFSIHAPLAIELGERFHLKTRCVTQPDTAEGHGVTDYSLKAWREGDAEPSGWDYTVRQTSATALRAGALALVAHEADVTFGDLTVTAP